MKKTLTSSGKYGPIKTENDRVGTVDAETPEAKMDAHGIPAASGRKRKHGGKVEGDRPKHRLDRRPRHSDEAEDKALIRKMVKPEDLREKRAHGGHVKAKKGTTVNVVIAPQGGNNQPPRPPMPPVAPPPPPPVARPPMPPPQAAMPPPGMGAMPPGGIPPQMLGRAHGGKVYPLKDAGAGSGEGRLQKERAYGKNAGKAEK